VDPDTGQPNVEYNIYEYLTPPRVYYRPEDILDKTPFTTYSIDVRPFTGTVYFLVTAFDGGAESLPSNLAQMQVSF